MPENSELPTFVDETDTAAACLRADWDVLSDGELQALALLVSEEFEDEEIVVIGEPAW